LNYQQAIDFLYAQAPMFQQVGAKGYKTGLENTHFLDSHFGFPHRHYRTIHVGGTNGKGSVSHLLAAILQSAGYKVGLYTSPHLKDFRERIRVNGKMISKQKVSAFIAKNQQLITEINPSFFEITTAFAFKYFAEQNVDFAVVEVGLGGRLDCTNVISPLLSVITNISLDHTDILGDTLGKIAAEKAGIIKPKTPVIIGETQAETEHIFREKAAENGAEIIFADQEFSRRERKDERGERKEKNEIYCEFQEKKSLRSLQNPLRPLREISCELKGIYQQKNLKTVLAAVEKLQKMGIKITKKSLKNGLENVISLTGLQGRWQILSKNPTVVCDTGHNQGGISQVVEQISQQKFNTLHIIFGMVNDKKPDIVLNLLPKNAKYYFTKAQLPRALNENILQAKAAEFNLISNAYQSVKQAIKAAKKAADKDDFIYIGGSTFIVAEAI
jgi:dihydrofolate synthase/folylpolyglutamate synthase